MSSPPPTTPHSAEGNTRIRYHTYEVELPITGVPYKVSESLSQRIEPGDVDRFLIKLIPKNRDVYKDYVFLLTVTLVYDEDEKGLSWDVLFASLPEYAYYRPSKGLVLREGLRKSDVAGLMSENRKRVEEIRKIKAVENDHLRALVQNVPDV
jgi:hypothetical protein